MDSNGPELWSSLYGRTLQEWIERLEDPDASDTLHTINVLATAAKSATGDVLIRIHEAFRSRDSLPLGSDEDVRERVFIGKLLVGKFRLDRTDTRVPRPDDLKLGVFAVGAIGHIRSAVSIYHGPDLLAGPLEMCTPGQRAAFALSWTDEEVTNGGFHQYFLNPTGIVFPYALEGARLLGDHELQEIFMEVEKVFPSDFDWSNHDARIEVLDKVGKDPFEPLDDRYYKQVVDSYRLMDEYVRDHPDEFFTD